MNETTLNGQSADIVSDNIQKLKQIFPEVFCEESIDFEKLQAVLGDYTDDNEERYNFTWWGKSRALRLAQTPSMGTLRPCKEESKDWGTTRNLYIEGDNLEVLKLLQKSYHGKVKMIYIDPPYNTGKDFVYPDDYKDPLQNYLEMTGQVDDGGKKVSTNSEASGRYHTNWLNMMYPRLRLARNLMCDDGVIFISIDDGEVGNLRKLCDEVFGEDNFVSNLIWEKKYTRANDAKWFSDNHDHILCYAKNKQLFMMNQLPRSEEQLAAYSNPDNHPKGKWKATPLHAKSGANISSYTFKNGINWSPPPGTFRRYNDDSMRRMDDNNEIWFGVDGKHTPSRKSFLTDVKDGVTPITIWTYDEVGHTHEANNELKELNMAGVFNNPKPSRLLIRMLYLAGAEDKEDIILDFFSGSTTTADAVMQLNAKDGGKRKFIMVQLPEPTDEKSEAHKAGYENICEIGKERIHRAGDKIKAELQEKQKGQPSILEENAPVNPDDLDVGFKVFKLDTSNLKKWNPDYENIEESLLDAIENYVEGRSELDVVYEIMLKYGIDLTLPLEEYEVGGKKIYSIGYGALIICLDREITTDIASEIVRLKDKLKPEVMRVVFKDNGFKDDSVKTNTKEILRNAGIDEIVSV
jgi:adenine-specific DNA-methyltransferase